MLVVDPAHQGASTITVDALDGSRRVITSSSAPATTSMGALNEITITLSGTVVGDMGTDAGAMDLSTADLAIHDLARKKLSFAAPISFLAGNGAASIAIADFNNDGKVDLAVANSVAKSVSILIGSGTGVFSAPVDYTVGTAPAALVAADFNGDSVPDLAIADGDGNKVYILINNGNGTFKMGTNYHYCVKRTALIRRSRSRIISITYAISRRRA